MTCHTGNSGNVNLLFFTVNYKITSFPKKTSVNYFTVKLHEWYIVRKLNVNQLTVTIAFLEFFTVKIMMADKYKDWRKRCTCFGLLFRMRYLSFGQTERISMGEKEIPQLSFTSEEVENGSALRMMSSERVCVYYVPDVVPVLVEKWLWEKERESGERLSKSMRERGKLEEGCVWFCFVLSTHAPAWSPVSMCLDHVMLCWLETQ